MNTAETNETRPSVRRAWYSTAILMICFTLAYVDRYVLSLLVNPVKESLQLSDTEIGIIQGVAFSLFFVIASLPLAKLSDRGDRPLIISWCIALWSLMTMLCGAATSFFQMMLTRIGVAVGEAGLPPGAMTMIADSFDQRRLARATSLFMLGPFLGGGLAFVGGGALYEMSADWSLPNIPWIGQLERWQVIFFSVGAPGFLLALVVKATLKEPRPNRVPQGQNTSYAPLYQFIIRHWKFCGVYVVSVAMVVMLLNAHIAWLPAAMIRKHGVDEGQMGLLFGPVYLVAGASGTLFAGWFIGRANQDTVRRTLMFMSTGTVILFVPSVLAPMVSNFTVAMVLIVLIVFCTSSIVSMASLPFQFTSPLSIRGQSIATLNLVVALIGTGLGPLTVGALSDGLANRFEHSLSVALTIVPLILIPVIVGLQWMAIRNHAKLRLDLRPGTLTQT